MPKSKTKKTPLSIVLIGAHPDDAEIKAGGTLALWAKEGFSLHVVCMTNGDAGHQTMGREALAARRKAEAAAAAGVIGARSTVLDNHDGELLPTLAVRREVISIIREAKADVVVTHRPNDYHPDHRYTAQVVQDAAYMVTVPHVVEEAPVLRKNPVFLYFTDHFERPAPFRVDMAVAVDEVMDTKWAMLDKMESQFYEWMPWHDGVLESVPADAKDRRKWLRKTWGPVFERYTRRAEKGLKQAYGKRRAAKERFAEAFEISEYGRQPSPEELRAIFPFAGAKNRKSSKR
jgi:LmbE family N-acetylglucosaminyl deacetylase